VFFLGWLSGSGWHLSATRQRHIHAFGFVFATAFAIRTALSSGRATFLTGWRRPRLLDAFIPPVAWLIETFTGTGCTGR
jgi:hypothetical protein